MQEQKPELPILIGFKTGMPAVASETARTHIETSAPGVPADGDVLYRKHRPAQRGADAFIRLDNKPGTTGPVIPDELEPRV